MVSIKKLVYSLAVMMIALVAFSSCNKESEFESMTLLSEEELSPELRSSVEQTRASWCWCTDYIKNRLGYWGVQTGDAKDMGAWLSTVGWYQVTDISLTNIPRNKDIVIFPQEVHKITNPAGHVAMIATSQLEGNNIHVTVVGANQDHGGKRPTWTECDCNNVCIWDIPSLKYRRVSIWRKVGS